MTDMETLLEMANHLWDSGKLRSAFRLFFAAAKLGDVSGQLNLGYFYDVGVGVKRNQSAALLWYRRAYRQGSASAASNIGTVLRDQGDSRKALLWFRRAINAGDVDANLELAKVYLDHADHTQKAAPFLRRVVMASRGVDVSESSQDEAIRLLEQLNR